MWLDWVRLLTAAPISLDPIDSIEHWQSIFTALHREHHNLVTQAVLGGFASDRVGWAFAGGYASAGQKLLRTELKADSPYRWIALCATEAEGAHPRAIKTTLKPHGEGQFVLSGHKRWVTFGTHATTLLVVATEGVDEQGRNRLRVVRIDKPSSGVTVRAMKNAPFVPEIPHAELDLDNVVVDAAQVLEGDGYDLYLKPFRTIEDLYVHAALLGYLARVARVYSWPREFIETVLSLIASLHAIAEHDASRTEVHLLLAGLIRASRELIVRAEDHWSLVAGDERTRWERDKALFLVAENARSQRTERAWELVDRWRNKVWGG